MDTTSKSDRFRRAIERIDAENARDPNQKELPYSLRMTEWLNRLEPTASEALKLAARSQHICRWEIPRSNFPMDRAGYLHWRKTLYQFHADKAAQILKEMGYDNKTIEQVQSLLKKEKLKLDAEMQTLEDVICLVFLENYFSDFAREKDEAKLLNIIRRTWAKMSQRGHDATTSLKLADADLALLKKALPENPSGS